MKMILLIFVLSNVKKERNLISTSKQFKEKNAAHKEKLLKVVEDLKKNTDDIVLAKRTSKRMRKLMTLPENYQNSFKFGKK